MSLTIRWSSRTQLWCLRHPNLLTRLVLQLFYMAEVSLYSVNGARRFLSRRGELLGPNYAALGKLIVGDYHAAAGIIAMPQRRGHFLGRGQLDGDRLPHGFLLSLSDTAAGGDGLHPLLRGYLLDSLTNPAQDRVATDDRLAQLTAAIGPELAALGPTPTAGQVTAPLQRFVIRYMFRALFQLDLDEAQVDTVQVLFYTGGLTRNYTASLLEPFALPGLFLRDLRRDVETVVGWIEGCPSLADHQPSEENAQLTRHEWAELLVAVIGIAALGGSGNLAIRMVSEFPPDHAVDLDDDMAVMRVVLESARRHAPVNNINAILPGPRSFDIQGQSVELPAGTVVAASIGLASLDPGQFPQPADFQPERSNLIPAVLNFNSIGFHPSGDPGLRTCPGRNVAVAMATGLFRSWRRAL